MTETERHVRVQSWADAVTRQIARRLLEGVPPKDETERFENAALLAHCSNLAAAQNRLLTRVVWEHAAEPTG